MGLKTVFGTIIILTMALVFSACETVFLNPLSNLREAKPDNRLPGKWISKDEKYNGAYIRFDGSANLETNISAFGGETQEQYPAFTMYTTKIGKHTYMNLNPADEDRDKGYLIVRYAIEGNQLTVWILDPDKVKAAIAQGKLKGTSAPGFGTTTVSDTSKNIAAYLESDADGELFQHAWRFEKVESK